jgi:uncharacterized ferritin-like protein (DUF455 family)
VDGVVEVWTRRYVESTNLAEKCAPSAPPEVWAKAPGALDLSPGRPPELKVTRLLPRAVKLSALQKAESRIEVIHKFWHHELQAAELMAWAILRFVETPLEFRKGLLRILQDEVRHMRMYEGYLRKRGAAPGDFPVRDWLWERVQECASPLSFVALLGMGFEGANLDHAERYAKRFLAVGDEEGAKIQKQVGREEVAHVRFATHWFRVFHGSLSFDAWRSVLPSDLGPFSVRGKSLEESARLSAGMPAEFLTALREWKGRS